MTVENVFRVTPTSSMIPKQLYNFINQLSNNTKFIITMKNHYDEDKIVYALKPETIFKYISITVIFLDLFQASKHMDTSTNFYKRFLQFK